MHEMDFHRGRLAVNRVFAGYVKVELQQVVGDLVVDDGTARIDVDLDGMTVVCDHAVCLTVLELDVNQIDLAGIAYIDRRLCKAFSAHGEFRRHFPPMIRARFAAISPCCVIRQGILDVYKKRENEYRYGD